MKILLIEDNQKIAQNIKDYLEIEPEREVDTAFDGEKGLTMAESREYDLVLLDLMLPKLDGKTFIQTIRKSKSFPIIVITAKSQIEDKLELFEMGADDYLTKPFDLQELLARCRAILRRGVVGNLFNYEDIIINLDKKEVKKNGAILQITLKEFQILELLIQNQGVAVSRTDILTEIRGEDSIWETDDKLDVYISTLRRKLGKNLIITVKGFGYRLGGTSE
ncbi:DNA-binding response regulator [candidate division SR1 bacterium]|nr:DNA-binding response regulator [candidate division SR1 bacterium]